ncbi:MAG: hypothetical protein ACK56F_26205, partial [bacterium]
MTIRRGRGGRVGVCTDTCGERTDLFSVTTNDHAERIGACGRAPRERDGSGREVRSGFEIRRTGLHAEPAGRRYHGLGEREARPTGDQLRSASGFVV